MIVVNMPSDPDNKKMSSYLRVFAIVLGLIGLAVSIYLLYAKLNNAFVICGVSTCGVVNSSKYSYLLGIPVSAYGVLFYLSIIGLLILKKYKLLFILSILGVIFSAYLTALEIFVIHAWCQWCVLSAWLTLALFAIAFKLRKANDD